MTKESQFKIKIEGPGISVDREVSPDIVQQVIMLVLSGRTAAPQTPVAHSHSGGAASAAAQAAVTRSHSTPHPPPVAIRGFLNQHGPKRSPDKITAMAEYLRVHDQKKTFSRADMVRLFEDAAEPVPGNLARDIKWTVKTGWIAPKSGEKDSYYITSDGIEAVDKNFPKELVKKTKIAPQGRRKKQSANGDD